MPEPIATFLYTYMKESFCNLCYTIIFPRTTSHPSHIFFSLSESYFFINDNFNKKINKKECWNVYIFLQCLADERKKKKQRRKQKTRTGKEEEEKNAQEVILVNFLAKPYNLKLSSVAV